MHSIFVVVVRSLHPDYSGKVLSVRDVYKYTTCQVSTSGSVKVFYIRGLRNIPNIERVNGELPDILYIPYIAFYLICYIA